MRLHPSFFSCGGPISKVYAQFSEYIITREAFFYGASITFHKLRFICPFYVPLVAEGLNNTGAYLANCAPIIVRILSESLKKSVFSQFDELVNTLVQFLDGLVLTIDDIT